jgi:selenide,water dikinase
VEFTRTLVDDLLEIFFDPQTSGGLLIAITETKLDALARALKSRNIEYWGVGEIADTRHQRSDRTRISIV